FSRLDPRIVKRPELRPLVLWIPAVARRAEGEDAFLGAALFLVAASPAESGIVAAGIERLLQRLGLHHLRIEGRAVVERVDAAGKPFRVGVNAEVEAKAFCRLVTEADHL